MTMTTSSLHHSPLTLQCRCGSVRGRIAPTRAFNSVICHCRDCQAFARHVGDPSTLDGDEGTALVQVPLGALQIDEGLDQLALVRLSTKGLDRWFAGCCRTPLCNASDNPLLAMAGVVHTCIGGRENMNRALGPSTCRVFTKHSSNRELKDEGIGRAVWNVLRVLSRGFIGRRKSPLFSEDGRTIVKPQVLTQAQRDAAYAGIR